MKSIDLKIRCGETTINTAKNTGMKSLDIDLVDVDMGFINDEVIDAISFEDYIKVHGIEAIKAHLKEYYTFNQGELTISELP